MEFEVIRNDICNMKVDAIVLPANPLLEEGHGTSMAIFERAGRRKLTKACKESLKRYHYVKVGAAVPTLGFDLDAKYIIHAVTPKWKDGNSGEYGKLSFNKERNSTMANKFDLNKIAGNAKDLAKKRIDSIDVEEIRGKVSDIKGSVEGMKDDLEFKLKELDIQLEKSINDYNEEYARMNDEGLNLYIQRTRAVDVIDNVTELVSSIANSPKSFDSDFEEINKNKLVFKGAEDFAEKELQDARKAASGAGAGIAAGAAVMSAAPTAAMWIATTFGTASTGTAISTLSGAAATKAALAWLGGGALSAGGGGVAAGNALLALAGPVGMGIAGASLLASIALFSRKRVLNNKEKNKEIESVKENTAALKEVTETIHTINAETITLREELMKQFSDNMRLFGSDYTALDDSDKLRLGTMVNNTKSLSALFSKTV